MDAEKISVDGFNLNISDAKARNMISDKYDPDNGTYVVGDTCINDDILYICNTDIDTPETFDSSKWDADTIGHYCTELKSNLIVLSPTTTSTITGLTSSSSAQDFTVQEAGFYQFYSQHNSGVQGEIKLANGNSETLWIIQNKNQNFASIIASPIFYLKAGTYKLTIQGTSCGYRKYTL